MLSASEDAQHLIVQSLEAGGISGGFAGNGMLNSSWKCSTTLYFCPSSPAITSSFLLITGPSGLPNIPAILLVLEYRFVGYILVGCQYFSCCKRFYIIRSAYLL
ncbi:hypothetical protein DPMN_135533 [Dreissena polymorpha]|uniref:Uncharacterized protein n=1 Tax=Dreissena polymorpha TaxID=45954 RepID=A0A9D4JD05_DREPO|nr:hypothetical protein DPMN_135533 [Dreissena polymorpha]